MAFCSNCGIALDVTSKFCSKCGAKVSGGMDCQALQNPVEPAGDLSMWEYFFEKCVKNNYANFKGRACRKEFLGFAFFYMLAMLPCFILTPLLITPLYAVGVRRMHDTGKSGWYLVAPVFLGIISNILMSLAAYLDIISLPISIGLSILVSMAVLGVMLYWLCKDSLPGSNQYGENPKGMAGTEPLAGRCYNVGANYKSNGHSGDKKGYGGIIIAVAVIIFIVVAGILAALFIQKEKEVELARIEMEYQMEQQRISDSIAQAELAIREKAKLDSTAKAQAEQLQRVQQQQAAATARTGSFTDNRDGKIYRWVRIGSQVWMAENLNYITDYSRSISSKKYGQLYEWNEAQRVCPVGWRLPSIADWERLFELVGGRENVAGRKLKAKSGWEYDDNKGKSGNGMDDYGFSALPGGACSRGVCRDVGVGFGGYWFNATNERDIIMHYANDDVMIGPTRRDNHSSVRCIRN